MFALQIFICEDSFIPLLSSDNRAIKDCFSNLYKLILPPLTMNQVSEAKKEEIKKAWFNPTNATTVITGLGLMWMVYVQGARPAFDRFNSIVDSVYSNTKEIHALEFRVSNVERKQANRQTADNQKRAEYNATIDVKQP